MYYKTKRLHLIFCIFSEVCSAQRTLRVTSTASIRAAVKRLAMMRYLSQCSTLLFLSMVRPTSTPINTPDMWAVQLVLLPSACIKLMYMNLFHYLVVIRQAIRYVYQSFTIMNIENIIKRVIKSIVIILLMLTNIFLVTLPCIEKVNSQ